MRYPFEGKARVTSPYGYRIHPITKERQFHSGIDIVIEDYMVLAVESGVVARINKDPKANSAGKYIVISHENGIESKYFHLSEIYVEVGQKVTGGQCIGKMGSTGASTGDHLHLEFRDIAHDNISISPTAMIGIPNVKGAVEYKEHWAEQHWGWLNDNGLEIHEKRFDDYITRGEVFALLHRLMSK